MRKSAKRYQRVVHEDYFVKRRRQRRYSITSSAWSSSEGGDGEAERLRGLEVDDQVKPRGPLDGEIGRPAVRVTTFDDDVLSLDVPEATETGAEGLEKRRGRIFASEVTHAEHFRRGLSVDRERHDQNGEDDQDRCRKPMSQRISFALMRSRSRCAAMRRARNGPRVTKAVK